MGRLEDPCQRKIRQCLRSLNSGALVCKLPPLPIGRPACVSVPALSKGNSQSFSMVDQSAFRDHPYGLVSKTPQEPRLRAGMFARSKVDCHFRTLFSRTYPPARNARAALRMAGATASISFSRIRRSGTLSSSSGFAPVSHAYTTAGESCSLKAT
jgi:hypothetical protein